MNKKSILGLILVLALALSLTITPIYAEGTSTATLPNDIATLYPDANIAEYDAEDGKHNIYWTEGINAPLMTSDVSLQGTGRYFEKHVEGSYISYGYPLEDGAGYYDLNKNRTSVHCYLASASNTLHWWFDQNRASIEKYVSYLKSGDIYSDTPGLRQLNGAHYNEGMWNRILTAPTLSVSNIANMDRYMHSLYDDPMVNTALSVYLQRTHDGYWPDLVWDYFINGYIAIDGDFPDPNTEANFHPDSSGGYLYPLFAFEKLSKRHNSSTYDYFNKNLGRLLAEGNGVNLSYNSASNAHAITIWGAEYNAEGNLIRIFYTDSDDYDMFNNAKPTPTVYGMRSYDVHEAENGQMYLSNNTAPNAKPGGFVLGMYTLRLMKDEMTAKVNDLVDPVEPGYAKAPANASYAVGSTPHAISIELAPNDTGYFKYQWYESPDGVAIGTPISGQNGTTYMPDTSTESVRYYYVQLTSYKNGKVGTFRSPVARITVSYDITDAATPYVQSSFNQATVKVSQYSYQGALSVSASVQDTGTLTYQWYKERSFTANLSPSGGTPIPGATTPYLVPDMSEGELYMRTKYYCIVTNTNEDVNGKTVSTKASNVIRYEVTSTGTLKNAMSPIITTEPQGGTFNQHDSVTLSVVAGTNDGGTLTYQWYKASQWADAGTLIPHATASSYTIPTDVTSNAYYYCVVTNTNGVATGETVSSTESAHVNVNITGIAPEPELPEPSTDNSLSSLTITNVELAFNKDTLVYNVEVAHSVNSIEITAIANDSKANVTGTGTKTLSEGLNTFEIVVTAESGAERTYTIKVTRAAAPVEPETPPTEPELPVPSTDNSLSSLTITNGELAFNKDILVYNVEVAHSVNSIEITAIANDSKANVTGTGTKTLELGKNTFIIQVTSESGAVRNYTLNVTRKAEPIVPGQPDVDPEDKPTDPEVVPQSSVNTLSNITLNDKKIIFTPNTLEYFFDAPHDMTSIRIDAKATDSKASVTGLGEMTLNVGMNTFNIVVTAENGDTRTYVVNISRSDENVDTENGEDTPVSPDTKPTDTPKNSALTLGLGIGIPSGLVIITLIVVIILKKRR